MHEITVITLIPAMMTQVLKFAGSAICSLIAPYWGVYDTLSIPSDFKI